jgi:hypothetical protein
MLMPDLASELSASAATVDVLPGLARLAKGQCERVVQMPGQVAGRSTFAGFELRTVITERPAQSASSARLIAFRKLWAVLTLVSFRAEREESPSRDRRKSCGSFAALRSGWHPTLYRDWNFRNSVRGQGRGGTPLQLTERHSSHPSSGVW